HASRYATRPSQVAYNSLPTGDVSLRVIRGADERTRLDVAEPHRESLVTQLGEFLRRPVPLDRQMHRRRTQVLADGDDVRALGGDVTHGAEDLIARLAKTDHDPAFADELR